MGACEYLVILFLFEEDSFSPPHWIVLAPLLKISKNICVKECINYIWHLGLRHKKYTCHGFWKLCFVIKRIFWKTNFFKGFSEQGYERKLDIHVMETYFFNLAIIQNHRNTEKNICNKRKHFRVTFVSFRKQSYQSIL